MHTLHNPTETRAENTAHSDKSCRQEPVQTGKPTQRLRRGCHRPQGKNKCENVFQTADFGPVLGTNSIYATNNCPISCLTIAGRWPVREAFESAIKKKTEKKT